MLGQLFLQWARSSHSCQGLEGLGAPMLEEYAASCLCPLAHWHTFPPLGCVSGSASAPASTGLGASAASAHQASLMHHPDAGKLGVKELWVQSVGPHESAYPVGGRGVRAAGHWTCSCRGRGPCSGAERYTRLRGELMQQQARSCAEDLKNCPAGGGSYKGTQRKFLSLSPREHVPRKSPRKAQGRWPLASQEVGLQQELTMTAPWSGWSWTCSL